MPKKHRRGGPPPISPHHPMDRRRWTPKPYTPPRPKRKPLPPKK